MKTVIAVVCLLFATPVFAGSLYDNDDLYDRDRPTYEVRPKYYTAPEIDGPMAPGSTLNPYTIRNRDTGDSYEIAPKYNSPLLPPGTYINPYVIKPGF